MKRAFFVAALGFFFVGCSTHSKSPDGVQVKLDTSGAAPTVLGKALTQLASFAISSIPSALPSLGALDCFAVNVRGGLVSSSSSCGGAVQVGTGDGAYSDIGATFRLLLPVGEAMT